MPEQYAIHGKSAREIAASVEKAVGEGALPAGARLPSVRRLAAQLAVSPSTVAAAVSDLRRRGIVVSRPRSGLEVAGGPPLVAPDPPVPEGVRDLANGSPDPAFLPALPSLPATPHRLYGDEPVLGELRTVASQALRADGIDPTELCVVNGALDGIERVLGAHLSRGDAVAVEDPGFSGVLDLVRALGLVPLPVPVDEKGMLPGAVPAGARAVILTPRGQNPTGAAFDPKRARDLARAIPEDVLVVEDDHLGPVAGTPTYTITEGRPRWAAVRSVSKWLGPDLRLAVLAGDATTIRRVEGRQSVGPGWVSGLIQRLVAAMWADPDTPALADQAATVYAGRRRALLDALAAAGVFAPPVRSGLNVWVPVPDEGAAVGALLARGYAVTPGSRFRVRSGPAVRITIANMRPAEAREIAEALRPPARRTRAA